LRLLCFFCLSGFLHHNCWRPSIAYGTS
jgi:hypothetical protein